MSTEPDLTHWHKTSDEDPSNLAPPLPCCTSKFLNVLSRNDSEHHWRQEDAVRDERVRIVTEAINAIRAYSDAAQSVLDNPRDRLMVDRATEKCTEAIRKVGCICPVIDVTSFGGKRHTVPGYDSRCGMHDHPKAAPESSGGER